MLPLLILPPPWAMLTLPLLPPLPLLRRRTKATVQAPAHAGGGAADTTAAPPIPPPRRRHHCHRHRIH
jgi:hypothetical protein